MKKQLIAFWIAALLLVSLIPLPMVLGGCKSPQGPQEQTQQTGTQTQDTSEASDGIEYIAPPETGEAQIDIDMFQDPTTSPETTESTEPAEESTGAAAEIPAATEETPPGITGKAPETVIIITDPTAEPTEPELSKEDSGYYRPILRP